MAAPQAERIEPDGRGVVHFHMDSNGWADLAYNAVACHHRFVFEGRGRGVRSAANGTTAGNGGAYAICYLGGIGDPFGEDAKAAVKAGGNWLTFAGSNRNGHRDWKPTACPRRRDLPVDRRRPTDRIPTPCTEGLV